MISFIKKCYYSFFSRRFARCGKNVRWGRNCSFAGYSNISIGNNVSIGRNSIIWTTNAKVCIENNVLLGPNVSIHTGNHDIHRVGKHIIDIPINDGNPQNYGDVIIEEGVWCGDGVKILKGVRIGRGSVIGAGSIVTKGTEPYGIYAGCPIKKIGTRFSQLEIEEHERLLSQES